MRATEQHDVPGGGSSGHEHANAHEHAQPPSLTDGLVLRDKWLSGDQQVTALLAQIASDDKQRSATASQRSARS